LDIASLFPQHTAISLVGAQEASATAAGMEVTSQYRLPLAGANLATATVAMALLCARLQAAETAPAPSIMGGAVLCSCEDRHLLWLWMHLPFQSYFCLNYHQWTHRMPYPPWWCSTQHCLSRDSSHHVPIEQGNGI
jgi:hypothetical protein